LPGRIIADMKVPIDRPRNSGHRYRRRVRSPQALLSGKDSRGEHPRFEQQNR